MPFVWSKYCDVSFLRLKELLTIAPILTLPIKGGRFTVYYVSSHIALGCVLM